MINFIGDEDSNIVIQNNRKEQLDKWYQIICYIFVNNVKISFVLV